MKYAVIIPEGAPDATQDDLDGATPLAAADTGAIDALALHGRSGTAVLTPEGLPCTDDVTLPALLGYDPRAYGIGAAGLEALAVDVALDAQRLALRLSLITVRDGRLLDLGAGGLSDVEGQALLEDLDAALVRELGPSADGWRILPTGRHRGLLVYGGDDVPRDFGTTAPALMVHRPVRRHLPRGRDADFLRAVVDLSAEVLGEHEVNRTRAELGELPATHAWPWGIGGACRVPSFAGRFGGLRGVMIHHDPLPAGVARLIGWDAQHVPRADGTAALGARAIDALDDYDIVTVCAPGPDDAGHHGDVEGKMSALIDIDRHIVAPLREWIAAYDDWRILVAPTHYTASDSRCHEPTPVPVLLAGAGLAAVRTMPYHEGAAADADLHIDVGDELMEYFLFGSGVRRGHG